MRRKGKFDGILVETTGLADPAPVAQTFFVDDDVRRKTRLDAIVTVVDAKHVLTEIDQAHEAQEQLAFADVVLLNKTDLVSAGELGVVEARIGAINPFAKIHRTRRCDVDLAAVLDKDAFNLARILEMEPNFLTDALDHEHDDQITSLSLTVEGDMDPQQFVPWIQRVIQKFGVDILRMKGVIAMENDEQRFVIQSVHMLIEGDSQRPWQASEKRESRLVFIGRNLPKDVLREGFERCRA
jgi:G3E family GTPase